MRRWKRPKRWQRRIAAFLAVILFMTGMVGIITEEDSLIRQAGRQLLESAEKKIFFDAVCAVSPLIGYMLETGTGTENEEPLPWLAPADSDQVTVDEEDLWQELEQLLLAEQTGQESQDYDSRDWFPEDAAGEENGAIEMDADLQAEIDRENEALRELARQQAMTGGQNQTGETGQAAEAADWTLSLPYSMEQLNDLNFLLEKCYNVNKTTTVDSDLLNASAMLARDMTLQNPDSGGPKILIHHTHATEYFADSDENDPSTLIVGVGDYLEELLETQYGIEVIHDRTVYPYNEAYSQALKNVEQILAENPTIEVFIDLHRDSGGQKKYTVEIDGKEMANLMFFNGLSRNVNGPIEYLANDNLEGNLAFSFQLKMAGDSMYPGLCKRNYLKSYRYNLHVLPRAVIVEVGDNNNTVQEAKNAMEPLARILYYVLTGK